jgi:actin-related protein
METERISVPELLFYPSDVGLLQAGVSETTGDSINSLSSIHAEAVSQNIVLTGGNIHFPNFQNRFENEVRQYIPIEYQMNVSALFFFFFFSTYQYAYFIIFFFISRIGSSSNSTRIICVGKCS